MIKKIIIIIFLSNNYSLLAQNPISDQRGFIKELLISGNPDNFCLLTDLVKSILVNRPKELKLTVYFDYKIDSIDLYKLNYGNFRDTILKTGCSKEFFELINKNNLIIFDKNFETPLSKDWNQFVSRNLSYLKIDQSQFNSNRDRNYQVIPLQVNGYRNQWIQDYFIPFKRKDKTLEILYYNDRNLATLKRIQKVTKNLVITKLDSILNNNELLYPEVQGGNLLILDSSLAFVGIDYKKFGKKNLKEILKFEKIIWIYSDSAFYGHKQAAFHIDLFMNFGGKIKMKNGELKNLIFFSIVENPKTRIEKQWNHAINQSITFLKEDLITLGIQNFIIDTFPLIFVDNKIYSYSNSIFEEDFYSKTKNMFLPHYKLNPSINTHLIEHKLKSKLKSKYNINTFFIRNNTNGANLGFEMSAKKYGSLRCLTKVLSRY